MNNDKVDDKEGGGNKRVGREEKGGEDNKLKKLLTILKLRWIFSLPAHFQFKLTLDPEIYIFSSNSDSNPEI